MRVSSQNPNPQLATTISLLLLFFLDDFQLLSGAICTVKSHKGLASINRTFKKTIVVGMALLRFVMPRTYFFMILRNEGRKWFLYPYGWFTLSIKGLLSVHSRDRARDSERGIGAYKEEERKRSSPRGSWSSEVLLIPVKVHWSIYIHALLLYWFIWSIYISLFLLMILFDQYISMLCFYIDFIWLIRIFVSLNDFIWSIYILFMLMIFFDQYIHVCSFWWFH